MITHKPKLTPEQIRVLLAFADELERVTKEHFDEQAQREKRYHEVADRKRHLKTRGRAKNATRGWQ